MKYLSAAQRKGLVFRLINFEDGSFISVDENDIVASARDGDCEAFEVLVKRYQRFINGYVSSLNVPESEKDDLVQEGLIGLLRAVRTYDGKSAQFSTYSSICVKNSIVSALRKYNRESGYLLTDDLQEIPLEGESFDSPELSLIDRESTNLLLDKIFSALSPLEAEVFELYLAEVPYAVIAKRLNKNEKSIDNALQRIKAKLKRLV